MKVKLEDGKEYEVYKVQRSIFNSKGTTSYLIYNEARDEGLETSEPRLCEALYALCEAPKFFLAGELKNGLIHFEKLLKGDDWF